MNLFGGLNPVEAVIISESEGPWLKPDIKTVVERANSFFVTFHTILQELNSFNRNRRNYLVEAMLPAFRAPHLLELMRKKTWCGENGHPKSTNPMEILQIDPMKICHKIDSLDVRGTTVHGDITTLDDDMWGRQLTKHILQGMEIAFSLRALASVTKIDGGRGVVKTAPHIVTYDRVILPSHPEAYQDTTQPVRLRTSEMKNVALTEAWDMPVSEEMAQKFIMESAAKFAAEESQRFKDIVKIFEIQYESIGLSADGKSVIVKDTESKDTFCVALESYVDQQISDVFRNLR